ncbi:nuclear transport factor 2 family protein [Actinomadura sp. GTD37]|uniref:nuclear transport factor 2 family protein n=1 Tax=Actinomadura sp. GTD37 TaxID=1778030 RepID=UPI0035C110A7
MAGGLSKEEKEAEFDRLASLYAAETDVRHPFAPLGDVPLRTRAELRHHFSDGPAREVERFEPVGRIHETADPEVVIYEFSYVGSVDGRDFAVPCIFVVRVRDGVIVESRDYVDHVGMARAIGRLDELAAALSA